MQRRRPRHRPFGGLLAGRSAGFLPGVLSCLLAATLLVGCARVHGGGTEFRSDDDPLETLSAAEVARRAIDARDMRDHIGFLASDAMLGRPTPGEELERAAAWIAERLAELGIEPAGEDGGYIHFWSYEAHRAAGDGGVERTIQVPNVVAVLAGSEAVRAGEYVIVTAHFDHLGTGEPSESGDSIYNGADDNASGVAGLLEVAEAFAALPERPARAVLFLATSGEERGLLGASAFADRPTVFLSEAVAVLNMDMIGRNSPDSVGVVGHDYSSLGPLLVRTAADHESLGLAVDTDPAPGQDLFSRSDHYPFARLGIPAIAITSGLHEHYHHPDDEAGRIDADKATRVARLVFLAAYQLATGEGAEWTEAGRTRVGR